VLLICPTAHRISIADHIHSDASASFPSLRIDLQTYGDQHDVSFGTCSILRHFAYRIERDFLVLPCDLIPPPSFPLSIILNKFRQESTLDDSICTTFWFETPRYADKHIADEWGPAQSSVPILWDEKTETLLHVDVPDRLGRSGDELKPRMSLLSMYVRPNMHLINVNHVSTRYPRSKLSNVLHDSSVYACSRSLLDVLQSKPTFESLRQEFIP
jgi:translation initiation factor eIF-2B subunit gamma